MTEKMEFECKYGYFTKDGSEYVITTPYTPKPWVNVISNGGYGIIVSQNGSGFSWLDNPNLNRITRYFQDIVEDNMGKYLYIRDQATGKYWSAGYKPTCVDPEFYECRHGIGYTIITSINNQIETRLKMFVSPDEPVEIWILGVKNNSANVRKLNVFSYIEWNLGVYNVENREFQKIFIDNEYDEALSSFITTKRLWEVANKKKENLNTDWDYVAFHSSNATPLSYEGDRESFIGNYRMKSRPRAMELARLEKNTGKWIDSIASLQIEVELQAGEEKSLVFILGTTKTKEKAGKIIRKYKQLSEAENAFEMVHKFWKPYLHSNRIETPDAAMNTFTNVWLKYQAISCRLWSRTAYYQSGGAYGFRDQLQDSQLFLTFMPELTREQICLHARHQYNDGTVKHWWQPLTEEGPDSSFSDDLLWLPFVVCSYLRETSDFDILNVIKPFLDGGYGTIYEHCKRSIDRAFHRFSPRGLPLIGEADWNDGLSGCGTEWIGESLWVGEFLYYVVYDFLMAIEYKGDEKFKERCLKIAEYLKTNINLYGWDGEWYIQGTTDSGKTLGSKTCAEGKIFLNPQIWAVLSDIVPEDRNEVLVKSIQKYLIKDYGPLLLYPAYSTSDGDIGYLTRYAPGLRENGGVYSHAAVWAIQAFCKLRMPETAYDIFRKICTIYRSYDIERYKAEPYVMPGNTDGPDSPNYGRGGWTWYTGSAAWLFRVVNENILGIRPVMEGLLVDPCIPSEWDGYRVTRVFRGATYDVAVKNPVKASYGVQEMYLNGKPVHGNVIPACPKDSKNKVDVILG